MCVSSLMSWTDGMSKRIEERECAWSFPWYDTCKLPKESVIFSLINSQQGLASLVSREWWTTKSWKQHT